MTERSPLPADVIGQLEVIARRLVDASRRFSAARWRGGSGRSVAAAVQALVTRLAELEHAVAIGAAAPPVAWRAPAPPPYPGALPDRLAVVSNDLVAALRAAPEDLQVWYAAQLVPVGHLAAAALAELQATTDSAARR